jgi:hypothetical protein
VRYDFRIPCYANRLPNSSIRNAAKAHRIRGVFGPPARERHHWSSAQDRPQIQLNFINETRIERLAEDFAAAFNQHARDTSFAKIF